MRGNLPEKRAGFIKNHRVIKQCCKASTHDGLSGNRWISTWDVSRFWSYAEEWS